MRVLITRPEREATALATALSQRGHVAVIAPLFRLDILHPPDDFAAALAACQAVLLTSANGARALAEASEQRSKPVFAVGDTTAATAEGLGFTAVTSASGDGAALAELVAQRLDPKAGPAGPCLRRRCRGRDRARGLRGPPLRPLRGARSRRPARLGAGGLAGARARRRHLLLAAGLGAVRPPRHRGRPGRRLPHRIGGRHQPGRRPAARGLAVQGDRSPRRGRPARPCWMRSTACPSPAYKGLKP